MRRLLPLLLTLPALAQPEPLSPDAALLAGREAWLAEPFTATAAQPHIVVILADDLGRYEIGLHGGPVPTPNIDRIAREGADCVEGTITSPICAPSRAGLMTGRYQQRFGFELITHERYAKSRFEHVMAHFWAADERWRLPPYQAAPPPEAILQQGLPQSEITLAEALRKAGYATHMVGKWHLGNAPGKVPLDRGFDHHYGFYGAFSLYAPAGAPGIVESHHDYFADKHEWDEGRGGSCVIYRDREPLDETVFLTERIADEAVRTIEGAGEKPLFLYIPFSAVHTPFQVPQAYYDRFPEAPDANTRVYWGMIAALDDAVGRILDALDAQGMANDTLVFFLSDNGGALYTRAADNSPLRGGKFSNFEGGLNVPWLVRYPAALPAGSACPAPVSALDIFPTALAAAGLGLPADRPYDGVDLLPYLRGEAPAPHEALYWRTGTHKAARVGDWKLIQDDATGWIGLFDLSRDPSERENLADTRPDQAQSLQDALHAWEEDKVPPAWPGVMEYHWEDAPIVFPL